MSKIAGLQVALGLLTHSRQNSARHHLLGEQLHPGDKPYQERIAETCLLLVEVEDHLHNLTSIARVCELVAGSDPDSLGFDPWVSIFLFLDDEYRMPVDQLSPRLTAWLEARPQLESQTAAKIQGMVGPSAWVPGKDGHMRPPTSEEMEAKKRAPEAALLRTMEQTFFTLTYAADLAEVRALVKSRGDIGRIAALVA